MKADAAQQRSLLELAEIDAELSRLTHRATHLPEQQRYDQALADQRAAADRAAVLGIALEDLDAQIAKLESEVDAVRKREDRDRGLLDSGSVTNSKHGEVGWAKVNGANVADIGDNFANKKSTP